MADAPRTRPGRPYPLGATWDGAGVNFALFSEHATGGRALPLRRAPIRRKEIRADPARASAPIRSGTCYLPGGRARARSTATGCTGRTSRRQGHRFNPAKAAARSLREGDRGHARLERRLLRLPGRRPRGGRDAGRPRQRAATCPRAWWSTPRSTGAATGRRARRWHRTVIYEVHVKGFTKLHPEVPPELRGTYAGLASRRGDRAPEASSASPRSSCCPSTTRSPRSTWSTAASPTTGATTRSASSAPTRASPRSGQRGRAGGRVQDDGEAAARGRHRGDPRRGLQPHRGGQPPRADALLPRHRQRGLLPAVAATTRATTWTTPARQHAQHAAPAHAPAHHGQPALLGARDARRRLPLRPRLRARARAARRGPALAPSSTSSTRTR